MRDWVAGGGSLLLIADHEPWAPAAEGLGRASGSAFVAAWRIFRRTAVADSSFANRTAR